MKNILLIHHGWGVGGGLIALLGLLDELRLKNKVTVLCVFDSIAVEYIKKKGVNVIIPSCFFYNCMYKLCIHSSASYFTFLSCIIRQYSFFIYVLNAFFIAPIYLRRIVSEFDVVYLNSLFISDWGVAAKILGKTVVMHVREPLAKGFIGGKRFIIRFLVRICIDLVIAVSKDNANRLNLLYKTVVVYDPVIKREACVDKVFVPNGDKVYFAYVGGSQRIKGFEQLIDSAQYLNSNCIILFIGDLNELQTSFSIMNILRYSTSGYYRKKKYLMNKLLSSNNIKLIGPTDNVYYYFRISRAIISPFSKPHASLPVLESFSMGKPVIVSSVQGSDELVNSNNGFIFDNGDSMSLAKTINDVSQLDNEVLEKMKSSCLQTISYVVQNNPSISELVNDL